MLELRDQHEEHGADVLHSSQPVRSALPLADLTALPVRDAELDRAKGLARGPTAPTRVADPVQNPEGNLPGVRVERLEAVRPAELVMP